jgi:diacylglycerol kinase (ATP)
MTVVLVGNAKSGRGSAARLLLRFRERLAADGIPCLQLSLNGPDAAPQHRFDPARFRGARAILACGGDGTVNAVTDAAIRTGTPVYHIPAGNENLVARRYAMDRNPETFVRALAEHRVIRSDLGLAQGRRFLIMATVGPDARVIERLHFGRTRALGHLAYFEPVLREAVSPYLPHMTITVDGKTVVADRPGWLIIANDREYAARLNFAHRAGPTSRTLTAVFLPAKNLRDCVNWVLRAWTRRHARDPRLVSADGTHIRVESPDGASNPGLIFQLDGEHDPLIAEHLGNGDAGRSAIDITLDPETLPVLVPPDAKI